MIKVKRQLYRNKKIKDIYNIEIPRRSINSYRKRLNVMLQKEKNKEFEVFGKFFAKQASKQASKQALLWKPIMLS